MHIQYNLFISIFALNTSLFPLKCSPSMKLDTSDGGRSLLDRFKTVLLVIALSPEDDDSKHVFIINVYRQMPLRLK